jgi:hypothetical protein
MDSTATQIPSATFDATEKWARQSDRAQSGVGRDGRKQKRLWLRMRLRAQGWLSILLPNFVVYSAGDLENFDLPHNLVGSSLVSFA